MTAVTQLVSSCRTSIEFINANMTEINTTDTVTDTDE